MRTPTYSPAEQAKFFKAIYKELGTAIASTSRITQYAVDKGMAVPYFVFRDKDRKLSRGRFNITPDGFMAKGDGVDVNAMKKTTRVPRSAKVADSAPASVESADTAVAMASTVVHIATRRAATFSECLIPDKLKTYVPFGFYSDLKSIVASKVFFPIYITGMSGNGKTLMVQQVCAALGREYIRCNITKRTDESDLIGSYELVDGNTIRREGPVLLAMRRGAILLLDETDYGTEDLLCLNGVLEGNPYFDKKTGEVIHPAPGFNIIATANTKGKGSDDGRYIGANVLNDAFLERFAITEEQDFPPLNTERKILKKVFDELGVSDDKFIENLILWADTIRKTFNDGGVDEVISTRRLTFVAKSFKIFANRKKAVEKCLNRFEQETKSSFLDLYNKIDNDEDLNAPGDEPEEVVPF